MCIVKIFCKIFNNYFFLVESSWQCFKAKCYKFVDSPLMWHDALGNCRSYGAILASIQNNEENNFIKNAMTKDSWIGLNDIGEAGT